MPVSILYNPTESNLDSIQFDATLTEQHSGEVDFTEHPVEQGADISDHARPKQKQLVLDCFLTDTPLPGNDVLHPGHFQQWRSIDSLHSLGNLRDKGSLVVVVTELKTYQNMVITSLTVPVDAKTGDGIRFSLTLRELRIVESQVDVHDAQNDRSKKKDKGAKPVAPATEQQESAASAGFGLGKKLFRGLKQTVSKTFGALGQ